MGLDIELDRRIPDYQDPQDISYVLCYRTRQEDPGLSGSSGHFICTVIRTREEDPDRTFFMCCDIGLDRSIPDPLDISYVL